MKSISDNVQTQATSLRELVDQFEVNNSKNGEKAPGALEDAGSLALSS